MKQKEHSLLYHTMHSRPMPGCLPLFFLLAMVVVGVGLWFAPVEMPRRERPKGVGAVYIKKDRLTDFVLRRKSPLPLNLPLHADPEYQEDVAAASMPLQRSVKVLTPPQNPIFTQAADSAVLDAAELLALPGEELSPTPQPVSPAPAAEEVIQADKSIQPVFHPGVEKEAAGQGIDGEEVAP